MIDKQERNHTSIVSNGEYYIIVKKDNQENGSSIFESFLSTSESTATMKLKGRNVLELANKNKLLQELCNLQRMSHTENTGT